MIETHQQVVDRWFAGRRDQTLRLDYPLTKQSMVLDLGGYEGGWAAAIYECYRPTVHIFEPVRKFAEAIEHRFASVPKIIPHRFGLAGATGKATIALEKDGSSIFSHCAATEEIQLQSAADFFAEYKIARVDLMKINIEGCEYDLLDHMLDAGLVGRVGDIQVQFHHFIPDAPARRAAIQQRLVQTHEQTWEYPFVWENWRLKPTPHRAVPC
jgi:FkbM family methyltransferase